MLWCVSPAILLVSSSIGRFVVESKNLSDFQRVVQQLLKVSHIEREVRSDVQSVHIEPVQVVNILLGKQSERSRGQLWSEFAALKEASPAVSSWC